MNSRENLTSCNIAMLRLVFVTFMALTMARAACAAGQSEARSVTYPVPIRVAGKIIPTPFYLRFGEQLYGKAPAAESLGESPVELALLKVLDAIARNDARKFSDLSHELPVQDAKQIVALYRKLIYFNAPTVERRWDFGGASYFVLRGKDVRAPLVQVVLINYDGEYRQSFDSAMKSTLALASLLIKGMGQDPKGFSPVLKEKCQNSISLMPLYGEDKKNSVEWLFDGCLASYLAYSPAGEVSEEFHGQSSSGCEQDYLAALDVYKSVFEKLSKDRIEEVLDLYEPRSSAKLRKVLKSSNQANIYKATMLKRTELRYIVANNQVFFGFKPNGSYTVLSRSSKGKWRIANFQRASAFDSFVIEKKIMASFLANVPLENVK